MYIRLFWTFSPPVPFRESYHCILLLFCWRVSVFIQLVNHIQHWEVKPGIAIYGLPFITVLSLKGHLACTNPWVSETGANNFNIFNYGHISLRHKTSCSTSNITPHVLCFLPVHFLSGVFFQEFWHYVLNFQWKKTSDILFIHIVGLLQDWFYFHPINVLPFSFQVEDVNRTMVNGRKPLHIAADYGQPELIEFLCSLGADVNVRATSVIFPVVVG